jgi:hypothetical protein
LATTVVALCITAGATRATPPWPEWPEGQLIDYFVSNQQTLAPHRWDQVFIYSRGLAVVKRRRHRPRAMCLPPERLGALKRLLHRAGRLPRRMLARPFLARGRQSVAYRWRGGHFFAAFPAGQRKELLKPSHRPRSPALRELIALVEEVRATALRAPIATRRNADRLDRCQ